MDIRSPKASTSGGYRGFTRGEEARPFPVMPSSSPSSLEQLDNYNSGGEEAASPTEEGTVVTSDGEISPSESGVHPGENMFNFPAGEGGQGPVRLTNLKPISPTNEDVYSSAELRSNPQPPISSPFLQMLSPSRAGAPGVGYPFLFANHPPIFSVTDNEKFRKLMLKKQKRDSKKEKNVKIVFKAEDVEGHSHEDDIESILQSLGEKADEKKLKAKKPKEKIEKGKVDKKERGRRSAEKELEGKTEEVEDIEAVEDEVRRGPTHELVTNDLLDFKNNFYLVSPSPEPAPLARTKSREALVASNESLTQFTKVTTKKNRKQRNKDEPAPGKPPPPAAPPEVGRRTSGYSLRSREVQPQGARQEVVSPTETVQAREVVPVDTVVVSLEQDNFPVLGKEDFPALPGGKKLVESTPRLPSAWARVVTKASPDSVIVTPAKYENTVQSVPEDKEVKDIEASDSSAVIECDVPSNSDIRESVEEQCDDIDIIDYEMSSEEKDCKGIETESKADLKDLSIPKGSEILNSELLESVDVVEDVPVNNVDAECKEDIDDEVEETVEDIEVVSTEDEFNRKKADNSAAVVILGDSDQDWRSSEFSFGFDINEDLVANGVTGDVGDVHQELVQGQQLIHPQMGTYYGGLAPGAPLTPIDTVDGAILSFGGPESGMRPLIVGVPVGVPVPVTLAGGTLHYFPPSFPHYSLPFPVAGPVPTPQFEDQEEPELSQQDGEEKVEQDLQEHQTISPESGISSASPLSWQPDSSPSLPAPGAYPHPHTTHASPPLVNHVNQSLSGWQGHSVSSSPNNSSRNSPAPGWATQMEDLSLVRKLNEFPEKVEENREESVQGEEDDDSGLALESGSDNSVDLQRKEKFNLGEIVTFVSSSWSNISKDSSVHVYSNSATAST